jgi:hypothetical protein
MLVIGRETAPLKRRGASGGERQARRMQAEMATTEDERRLGATDEWRRELYDQKPEREALFTTISGLDVDPLYTPDNVEIDYERDIGYPGVYPYTRGVYPSMQSTRSRTWSSSSRASRWATSPRR